MKRIMNRLLAGLRLQEYIVFDPLTIVSLFPPRRFFGKIPKKLPERFIVLRSSRLKFLFSTYGTLIEMLLGKSYFYHEDFIPRKGYIIFDVGAYVGHYSLIATYLGAQVYAFEPIESNYRKLLYHIHVNKELLSGVVIPIKVALGSFNGEVFMQISNATSHIVEGSESYGKYELLPEKKSLEKVSIMTLDKFVEEHSIRQINILKIDVEGYEFEVLKGARKSIVSGRIHMILSANYHFAEEDTLVSKFLEEHSYKKILTTPGPAWLGGGISYYKLIR